MTRRRHVHALVVLALVLGSLLLMRPAWAAGTITAVAPSSPVLAGTQVFVTGGGFPAGGPVSFTWDGVASPETPVADAAGDLSGAPVTVPVSLDPGTYDLVACSPAPDCSAPFPMVVGPVLSTTEPMPVNRGQTMTVTVAGLQPGSIAISGWNGVLSATGPVVPDTESFDLATVVPADAPASSVFEVCQQETGSTCTVTPRTRGRLDVAVVVPPPPPPPPSPNPPPPPPPPPTAAPTPRPTYFPPLALPPPPPPPVSPTASPSASPTPEPPAEPTPPTTVRPMAKPSPLLTQREIVGLEVVAFAILSLLGGTAMLRSIAGLWVPGAATGAVAGALAAGRGDGDAGSAKVKDLLDSDAVEGHRSWTWRWPGAGRFDALALAWPVSVAPASPLLARVLVDASYLRAITGLLSLLLPVGGIALGLLAAADTAGQALPPSFALLLALALLGVVDALAGLVAVGAFIGAVALSGGFEHARDVRTMLGLGVVWFAVPLIAAAARPLRRGPPRSTADRRRRVADVVIASLIGAWAVQKMMEGLPGLAEQRLEVSEHATALALAVLGMSAVRIAVEELASRFYPSRLDCVQPSAVPAPGVGQRVAACLLRTALFLFVVGAFIGVHWQLWLGGLLFLLPQLLDIAEDRFPNSERLYAVLPRGLVKVVVMLFVGTALGWLALEVVGSSDNAARNAFVLLAGMGLVLSLIEVHGREGPDPVEGWGRWLAGAGVLGVGVLFVLGYPF